MTRPSVLTIGNFDGVHLGHRRLLNATVRDAAELDARPLALTFEPHPTTWFAQREASTFRLMTVHEKSQALARLGTTPDILPFDGALASLSAEAFVLEHLVRARHVRRVHIGEGFVFGAGRTGTTQLLHALGDEHGFDTVVHRAETCSDGVSISSTRLRDALREGDLRHYHSLAGAPWAVTGQRERGAQRGRTMGIPTINLYPRDKLLPPHGVYATWIDVGRERLPGITNLGLRPTFEQDAETPSIETLCLDASPHVAPGENVTVHFVEAIRAEQRFDSPEQLRAQIDRDVVQAREAHRRTAGTLPALLT